MSSTVHALDLKSPAEAPPALLLDFLAWVEREPRTYAETLEAWHTHCPRLPVWEDAFSAGLVRLRREPGVRLSESLVAVTERGREMTGAMRDAKREAS